MWTHSTPPRLRSCTYRAIRSYFITFCVLARRPIFADAGFARAAQRAIMFYREIGWYWLPAYCVMPDHIHLLMVLATQDRTVARVVASLKNRIAYEARKAGPAFRWQRGFH